MVCQRWHRLVLETPALWSTCIINPAAEAQAARRSIRQQQQGEAAAGASPVRSAAANRFYDASDRSLSEASTPNRAASPVLGSSPDSDTGGYWSSQFAPYTGQHNSLQATAQQCTGRRRLWGPHSIFVYAFATAWNRLVKQSRTDMPAAALCKSYTQLLTISCCSCSTSSCHHLLLLPRCRRSFTPPHQPTPLTPQHGPAPPPCNVIRLGSNSLANVTRISSSSHVHPQPRPVAPHGQP